jgi:hypothetical protein
MDPGSAAHHFVLRSVRGTHPWFYGALFVARHIANRPRPIYKPRIVTRTGEDLHDFDVFADRALAFDAYAGRLSRPLRATSASIDRA